jgi:hypothetical protein
MPRPLLEETALDAVSALNTARTYGPADGCKAEGFLCVVTFGAGTNAGVVLIEGAADPTFAGTWATLATITWAAASRAHETFIAGSFIARRVRISTGVTGGTVSAKVLITG